MMAVNAAENVCCELSRVAESKKSRRGRTHAVFDHVGLLVNELSGTAGPLFA
jgi:hypothetical protein